MNELKYVDPKADLTFKKVFGEHSDLLASLLNALLPLPEDGKIVSIEYLPPEIVPDDPLHKDSIVDVRCKDQNGRQFIVEMQMIWSPDYNQRALFNAAKAYSRELPAGGNYRNLKMVYSLNLLNDNLDLDVPQWYHHYRLEHREVKGETIDGIQLVFVELKKFTPHTWPERKMAVLWLRFLTEINGKIRARLRRNLRRTRKSGKPLKWWRLPPSRRKSGRSTMAFRIGFAAKRGGQMPKDEQSDFRKWKPSAMQKRCGQMRKRCGQMRKRREQMRRWKS